MRTLTIETAEVFEPLLVPSRYKAAYGGRGSGKSHFFAGKLVEDALAEPGESGEGMRAVCIREIQKSLKDSAKRLVEDKIGEYGLGEADGFKIFREVIETPNDGVITFQGMQDHTAESIKSLEGFRRAWVEEAQTLTTRSLQLLRPTIRADNSELWFSWNPRLKTDPVDQMFRGETQPTNSHVVRANWSDNPWFPAVLEQERQDCLNNDPDQYAHIWEGDYATVLSGAYYAKAIAQAKGERRITDRLTPDPLIHYRVFCDLGGTGAKADAFAMWVAQFVGREIRCLNYYEAVGQPLATHVEWLRAQGYGPKQASIWLPHDGETNDRITDVSFASAFRDAGYDVEVIPNQGKGAARTRIEAARRLFPSIWFKVPECQAGLDALGWYHEKRDEARNLGLGPEHDWSSHGADAFGLMAVAYEEPRNPTKRKIVRPVQGGWMG